MYWVYTAVAAALSYFYSERLQKYPMTIRYAYKSLVPDGKIKPSENLKNSFQTALNTVHLSQDLYKTPSSAHSFVIHFPVA